MNMFRATLPGKRRKVEQITCGLYFYFLAYPIVHPWFKSFQFYPRGKPVRITAQGNIYIPWNG